MSDAHYTDPRLVALYDLQNTWGADDDLFRALAGACGPCRVLDLGCGTGRLALALAADGHTVTGVDPAAASLVRARSKPGAERVRWVHGTMADLATGSADVALMTSHVAQVFLADADWQAALAELSRVLVPGGRLAFDSRDPAARAWEGWDSAGTQERLATPDGDVHTWTAVEEVDDRGTGSPTPATTATPTRGSVLVTFTAHNAFPDGSGASSRSTLRFRSEAELRASLTGAGFTVDAVHGGWYGEPVGAGVGELVVRATR